MSKLGNHLAIYNSGGVTLTDGDSTGLFVNASGYLLTASGGTGASSNTVQGAAADNAAAVGNPVLVGGKYFSAQQTYTNGDVADLEVDVNGILKVVEQYAPAYEDNTNQVAKVEQRFSYTYCAGADTQVKAGAGFLHTLTFTQIDAAPTAGTIIVYDSLTEANTIIFSSTWTTAIFYPTTVTIDVSFATGLYVGFTTTNDIGVTVSYR